jgi:hypothetical protein
MILLVCYNDPGLLFFYICHTSPCYRTFILLHNEELHNLYSSPSIITMIKSRRMRWSGHVPRMGEKKNVHRVLVGKPEGTNTGKTKT